MDSQPTLPIPISLVHGRYLLFSIQVVSYLRREHHICGALVGTIPQSPSQNVFLGLPVELMPEEAQILVSKGVAYVSDDALAHLNVTKDIDPERQARYLTAIDKIAKQVSNANLQKKESSRQKSLKALSSNSGSSTPIGTPIAERTAAMGFEDIDGEQAQDNADESLFSTSSTIPNTALKPLEVSKFAVTPTTSEFLLPSPPETPAPSIEVPSSYPLFKHLYDKGYYLSPGLRFGCQYTVYPGDPLRFHSHFLAVSAKWDEEIDLMDIVGGGRLGTGVKKSYLFGGANPQGDVKTFSIEWAGM
jgi:tRNA-splicing endonuclease subunit Sen34